MLELLIFLLCVTLFSFYSVELPENQISRSQPQPVTPQLSTTTSSAAAAAGGSPSSNSGANVSTTSGVFASVFGSSSSAGLSQSSQSPSSFSSLLCAMGGPERLGVEPISLSLSTSIYLSNHPSSLFSAAPQDHPRHYATNPQSPALSATALLQKAAQIGATSSSSSFLRGLGLAMPVSSNLQDNIAPSTATTIVSARASARNRMMSHVKIENHSLAPGLGLGLPSDHSVSGYNDLMMRPPTMFGGKPTTLDLLGMGIGPGDASSDGISAYLTSIGGGLDVSTASSSPLGGMNLGGAGWDDSGDRKPALL